VPEAAEIAGLQLAAFVEKITAGFDKRCLHPHPHKLDNGGWYEPPRRFSPSGPGRAVK
jgi:hypothetical protein